MPIEILLILIVLVVVVGGAFFYLRNRTSGGGTSRSAPMMPPSSMPARRDENIPAPRPQGGSFPDKETIDRNVDQILGNLEEKQKKAEEGETNTSTGSIPPPAPPAPAARPAPVPKPIPASPPVDPDFEFRSPSELIDEMESVEEDEPSPEPDADEVFDDFLLEQEEESAEATAFFLATYPKSIPVDEWHPMYAYVFRPSASMQVYNDAAKQLGEKQSGYSSLSQPASTTIREGAEITATPELDGFQFKPLRVTVGFYDSWERFNFEIRARSAPLNQFTTGRIIFTVEGLIVGEVPLSIYVGATQAEWELKPTPTKMYQSIFCSYSHADTKIIERVERAYKALGMDYLRDITTLKSGTHWSDELLALIDRADVFQLFWSNTAAESQYVKQEWEHALKHEKDRPNFIRPVWWKDPMPPVPKELGHIHFWHQPDLDDEE